MEAINEDWGRAVAIVAHPDDLEYGSASAVARWTSQGKEFSYAIVTSGEAGIAGIAPDKARPLREEEQRRSAAVVGVNHVEFLGHPDGAVEYGLELRRDLAGVLRRLKPEIVIGMNFDLTWGERGNVNHADHRVVGLAVLDACRDAANEWLFPDFGLPWDGIKAIYISGAATATHYVDVTDTIGIGVASLRQHGAYIQALGTDFDPDDFLRSVAGFGGMVAGCDLAVLFQAFNVV